ncbi:hypothetical protein MHYP_G00234390 [Metynnis hypsauchen]
MDSRDKTRIDRVYVSSSIKVLYYKTEYLVDSDHLPRREGPFKVILATPTAVKVEGQKVWIHLNHCSAAPPALTPPQPTQQEEPGSAEDSPGEGTSGQARPPGPRTRAQTRRPLPSDSSDSDDSDDLVETKAQEAEPSTTVYKRKQQHHEIKENTQSKKTSKTNTVTPELSQVTAMAAAEIPTPTTETHIMTVVSGEIPVETKKASKISANNDVPTATDTVNEISVAANDKVAEISVTAKEAKVINMAADNIVLEIFMKTTHTNRETVVYNEADMAAVELIEKLFSAYMESRYLSLRLAELNKPCGGSPGPYEEQDQTERTQTDAITLPLHREQQLMNRGLMNLGNSCYVNASLQCLFSAESFCTQLLSQLSALTSDPSANLIRHFTELWTLRESVDRSRKALLLWRLIKAAADINPAFGPDTQNDAHEFLFHCLRQMEEIGQNISWSRSVAYECPVRSHFGFQLMFVITCRGCDSQKSRQEDFNHLAVALVPQGSVTDCIKLFFSDEAEIECRCEVCGCNSASCSWVFHTLPRCWQSSLTWHISRQQALAASRTASRLCFTRSIRARFIQRDGSPSEREQQKHNDGRSRSRSRSSRRTGQSSQEEKRRPAQESRPQRR